MLNENSIRAVNAARYTAPFIKPLYDSYGFSRIPHTVQNLLTGSTAPALPGDVLGSAAQRPDAVILFFIDAFGWRFFEQHAGRYPFLQHFVQNGVVSKLTSMFPSTTAAHVTSIHTGQTPGQSGVYEWFMYEPKLDAVIAPLLFSFAGETVRDTLVNFGVSADSIFPRRTIYQRLKAAGVESFVFQPRDTANTAPAEALLKGAREISYKTLPEALVRLAKLLASQDRPTYYFLYFGNIDSICHTYGPNSAELEAEFDAFFIVMERLFLERLLGKHKHVLFMLTADHGQIEVDPATTIYLNYTVRGFRRFLQLNRQGQLIVPEGSPRDMFLHIKPELLDEAQKLLTQTLKDSALVVRTQELIERGFFGPLPASPNFLDSVGNLVVLPFKGETVFWYEREKFEMKFFGHHGGLTREEMEIPLLVCEL
jgi:predicted AlkP superfamily pyrophosphatase or phosphodiesterase